MLFIYNPKTQNHLFLIEMIKQQLQSYSIPVQEIHEIQETHPFIQDKIIKNIFI